jgi:hypothetical protein
VNEDARKQIVTELTTLYEAASANVVGFHGAFYTKGNIMVRHGRLLTTPRLSMYLGWLQSANGYAGC